MPGDASSQGAPPGHQLTRKIILALALSSILPVLVFAYVAYSYVVPGLGARGGSPGLLMLVVCTGIAMAVGGYIIWDLGRTVAGLARVAAHAGNVGGLEKRRDEVGTLMVSFNKMLTTIEHQAAEINSFAGRLDSAYKELESTNARLKEFSFRDDVTGLYNRRFFGIRLEEEISRYRRFNHPVSVVMMDLDGFKAVNDTLGHAVGDETLREVAQILLKHSRGINVVCRYGGDEFAILLVETSKAGASLYGDRIRQVIAGYAFSHRQPITASLGIASLPDDEASTSEDLVRVSDEALYTAKRAGKNQVALAVAPEKDTWSSSERS
jgi:diguanylate cyclase (GGDEF)-like protein